MGSIGCYATQCPLFSTKGIRTMVTNTLPLKVSEVATLTRVTEKTVRRWMLDGVKGKKLGHERLPSGGYRIPVCTVHVCGFGNIVGCPT